MLTYIISGLLFIAIIVIAHLLTRKSLFITEIVLSVCCLPLFIILERNNSFIDRGKDILGIPAVAFYVLLLAIKLALDYGIILYIARNTDKGLSVIATLMGINPIFAIIFMLLCIVPATAEALEPAFQWLLVSVFGNVEVVLAGVFLYIMISPVIYLLFAFIVSFITHNDYVKFHCKKYFKTYFIVTFGVFILLFKVMLIMLSIAFHTASD